MQDLFIEFLPPWVETGLQPAFYDRESGTVLQQTARMYAKVNELVKAVNGMDKVIKEYVDYIDNYFKNLDVQEEINNKLDDMAEGGELAEYIAQYANLPCVHAYDTIADMASSSSLVAGSFARAMSKTVAGTGDGAYYKIRDIEEGDDPDGENLVAVGDALVAEKIPDYTLDIVEENINDVKETIANLNNVKSLVVISDSYGVGNSYPSDITSYALYMKDCLDLDNDTFYNNSYGGCGFAHVSNGKTFLTLVNEAGVALSEERRNGVTHVLMAGGYNDQYSNDVDIRSGISACVAQAHTLFPNAKICIAHIGWSTNDSSLNDTCTSYINGCGQIPNAHYINSSENILRGDLISGDNIHPNEEGYKTLAYNLVTGLQTGTCTPQSPWKFLKDNENNDLGVVQINNDMLTFEIYGDELTASGTADGTEISYKTLASDSMISGHSNNVGFQVPCIFVNNVTGKYVFGSCQMKFNQRIVTLKPFALSVDNSNYFSYTSIRILPGTLNIPHKCI